MGNFLSSILPRSARLVIGGGLVLASATFANAQSIGFAMYRANIGATAIVKSSNGVQGAITTGVGRYEVTFSRPVATCTTVGGLAANIPGSVTVFPKAGFPNVIAVRTFDGAAAPANITFSLIVTCGP